MPQRSGPADPALFIPTTSWIVLTARDQPTCCVSPAASRRVLKCFAAPRSVATLASSASKLLGRERHGNDDQFIPPSHSVSTTTMAPPIDLGTAAVMISAVAVQHACVRRSISRMLNPGIQQRRSALPCRLPVRRPAHRGHQAKASFPHLDLGLLFAVHASPASSSY